MTFASLPRRWRIVLLGSLGLNLLVAGLAVGALFDGRGRGHPPGPRGIAPLVMALPEADRAALAAAVEARGRPGDHPRSDARRARFDALLAELRRDPFDPEAAQAALAAQRELGARRMAEGEAVLVERLAALDPGERAAYADRLDKMISRKGR